MGQVKESLALHSTISTYGKVVQRALAGYRDPSSKGWWRPDDPDLLALGHPDLLLGSVTSRTPRSTDSPASSLDAATRR